MRHGKKINHLSRKSAHRKAMLANMACSLIEHKRISTTVAKAKALQKYVEPLITKSKTDSTHSRRVVFSYLKQKGAAAELFREVAPKISDRPGGYTRIIKTGPRMGDNAEMCFIELVDFNELYTKEGGSKKKSRSRRRRGGKKGETSAAATEATTEETTAEAATDTVEDAVVVEETKEEAPATEEASTEEASEESTDDSSEEEKKDGE
jgi:large subunit ribosomal protein L17